MPHPFNVAIPGTVKYEDVYYGQTYNYVAPTALYSIQQVDGVTRRKPKTRWIKPTNYDFFYRGLREAVGFWEYHHNEIVWPTWIDRWTGTVGSVNGVFSTESECSACLPIPYIYDSDIGNRSLIKALTAMKRTDINLGVAFAERNATANLLGTTASNIGKSFRDLRRGKIRSAMNHLGISSKRREPRGSNVPNKWLELQYGWKPLLSDVFGACEALGNRDVADWRVTAKGKQRKVEEYSRLNEISDRRLTTAVVENRALTRIDALPQNEAIISFVSLGITNPALIAWELVPFSFVVDWALPIGEWLETLDALLGYGDLTSSTSVFTKARWVVKGTTRRNGPSEIVKSDYIGSQYVVALKRTAVDGVPMPHFPSIKDPRSLGHMANGLALLAGAFGKR